ncbi:hypothetical protein T552_03250 [Pneumocystis carinii B80]|uniref:Uncharacterized protein n=1 Tax=Pneumocystis carinii (strain B80) TaxID=1408658 RepID=A0A0W4ZC06_PNEC8|nr:hypothetical protein T552_03250 [Pneumocystis carinii B80]KTW25976.1 hypothetical protein T552_03250 [Pneumocystis carinii B80]
MVQNIQDILEILSIHGKTVPDSEWASFFLYTKIMSRPGRRIPLLYISQDVTYLPQSTRVCVLNSDGTASEETAITAALGIPVFESCEGMSSESSPFQLLDMPKQIERSVESKYERSSPSSLSIMSRNSPTFYGRTGLSSLPIQEVVDSEDGIDFHRPCSDPLFSSRNSTFHKSRCENIRKTRLNTELPLKKKRATQSSILSPKKKSGIEEFSKNSLLSSEKKENKKELDPQKKRTVDTNFPPENIYRTPKTKKIIREKNNSGEKSTLDIFANDLDFSAENSDRSLRTNDTDELTTNYTGYVPEIATVDLEDSILYVYFPTNQIKEILVEVEFISTISEATNLGADGKCYCLNLQCLPRCQNLANIRFDFQKIDNKNIHLSDTQIATENLEEGIDKSIIDVIDLTDESLEKRSWQCFWQVHLDASVYNYLGTLNVQTKVDIKSISDAVVVGFSSNIAFDQQNYDLSNILNMGLIQNFHICGPPELQFISVKSMGILHWKCDKVSIKDNESNSKEASSKQHDICNYLIRITRKKEYGFSDLLIESEVVILEPLSTSILGSCLHVPYFKTKLETIQFMKTSLPLLSYVVDPETRTDWKLTSNKDNLLERFSIQEYQCISGEATPLSIRIERLLPLGMFKETVYLNSENYIENVNVHIFPLSFSQWCLFYKISITDTCIFDDILLHLRHDTNPSFITVNGKRLLSGVYSKFDGDIYILSEDWIYKDSRFKFEIGWIKDTSKSNVDKINLPIFPDNGIKKISINIDSDFGKYLKALFVF